MDGRRFVEIAQELIQGGTEGHYRAAAGRAYYGLLHEGWAALKRWSIPQRPRESVHSFVRLRFTYAADKDLKKVGDIMDGLVQLRNQADYELTTSGPFASPKRAEDAINSALRAVTLLDTVEGDPVRTLSAIVANRKAFP